MISFVYVKHWITLYTLSHVINHEELLELWSDFLEKGWITILLFSISILKCHKSEICKLSNSSDIIMFIYVLINIFRKY